MPDPPLRFGSALCNNVPASTPYCLNSSFHWTHVPKIDSAVGAVQEVGNCEGDVSQLHACWLALLERMLEVDQTSSVLKALDAASARPGQDTTPVALLNPSEAHQLVETARNLAHQGRNLAKLRTCFVKRINVVRCIGGLWFGSLFGHVQSRHCDTC